MSAQPSVGVLIDLRSVDWRAYFDRVLPPDHELTWRDLQALGHQQLWRYELIEGVLLCIPRQPGQALQWRDLQTGPVRSRWVFELVEGTLIVSPNTPSLRHQLCAFTLAMRLREACPAELQTVIAPFEFVSGAPFTVQPDILVARRPLGALRLEHAPELVVEIISDSTERRDLGLKRIAYERAGVPHFWVIYPETLLIRALRLVDGSYREQVTVKPGETFAVEEPVRVSFDPADLID